MAFGCCGWVGDADWCKYVVRPTAEKTGAKPPFLTHFTGMRFVASMMIVQKHFFSLGLGPDPTLYDAYERMLFTLAELFGRLWCVFLRDAKRLRHTLRLQSIPGCGPCQHFLHQTSGPCGCRHCSCHKG